MSFPPLNSPALDLYVQVKGAGTITRLDDHAARPEDRPQALNHSSARWDGFKACSFALPRRLDRAYADLQPLDEVAVISGQGETAWEGYVTELPKTMTDGHSVQVSAVGHLGRSRDEPRPFLGVDRDISGWGPPSLRRRGSLIGAGFQIVDPQQGADPATIGRPTVRTQLDGPWPRQRICEALYDAGPGNRIGSIYVDWVRANGQDGAPTIDPNNPAWGWNIGTGLDDVFAGYVGTANLRAFGPDGQYRSLGIGHRCALIQQYFNTASGESGKSYPIDWRDLTVYGDHGLPIIGSAPGGLAASDITAHVLQTMVPGLTIGDLVATSYPIRQFAYKDAVDPYDLLLAANAYHLLDFGVWEDKRFNTWLPNLDEPDWIIRLDQPGVTVTLQGDSIDQTCNGIQVEWTDPTGTPRRVTPATHPELADPDPENLWTRAGRRRWPTLQLSLPVNDADAVQIGRMALADRNQLRAPGQISIPGWARDRGGQWKPAWKIRAGQTIAIEDAGRNGYTDRPRVITEAGYSNDTKTATLTVDSTVRGFDAVMDRFRADLAARGLNT